MVLKYLNEKIQISKEDSLESMPDLFKPVARVFEGMALSHFANAAIDISDGLAADLTHILEQSNVGAQIQLANIPLSKVVHDNLSEEDAWKMALTSGDDYELCFTIPPAKQKEFEKFYSEFYSGVTLIGTIIQEQSLHLLRDDGTEFELSELGYEHFKQ